MNCCGMPGWSSFCQYLRFLSNIFKIVFYYDKMIVKMDMNFQIAKHSQPFHENQEVVLWELNQEARFNSQSPEFKTKKKE